MSSQGKRNILSKFANMSMPSTDIGIDIDAYKNKALNKLAGSDFGNLLKGDLSLSGKVSAEDSFNIFANKIVGSEGIDYVGMGVNALPADSSLDAKFFQTAVDKTKPVSIKEGMILDDFDAVQKFNEFQTSPQGAEFNQIVNNLEGTSGVDYLSPMGEQLRMLAPESSNSDNVQTGKDLFPRSNVLHDYSPYNYIVSLSCISKDQFNSGDKNGVLILKSGGAGGQTYDGLDYYIDNLVIRNTVAPTESSGSASVYQILFNVIEPYGVQFLDTLIKVAQQQGYNNHLNAVYMLKIEFKGYDDDQKPTSTIPRSARFIPIHIYSAEMNVEAGITTYQLQAAPAHYTPLMDIHAYTAENVRIQGTTVGTLVNNFFEQYTRVLARLQKDKQVTVPDEFELLSPESDDILTAVLGSSPFSDPKNQSNTTNLGQPPSLSATVLVKKGQNIVDWINKVVIESEYYRNKFDDDNNLIDVDGDGFTTALRIFTKVEILSNDNGSGRPAFKIKYILRTQRVSKQHFNYKTNDDLVSNVKPSRTYDYLYTGQNKDVLNFDITYKFAFYQPVPYFSPIGNATANNSLTGETEKESNTRSANQSNADGSFSATPVNVQNTEYETLIPGNNTKGLAMANLFDRIIKDPTADLLVANMEILGDPYWIEQKSVLSNTMIGRSDGGSNTDLNDAVLPDDTEVFIRLNFKAPTDVNDEKGLFKIQDAAFFKGIYKVFLCESRFEGGMFTQNLQMVRMRHQWSDVPKRGTGQFGPGNRYQNIKDEELSDLPRPKIYISKPDEDTPNVDKKEKKSIYQNKHPAFKHQNQSKEDTTEYEPSDVTKNLTRTQNFKSRLYEDMSNGTLQVKPGGFGL